MNVRVASRALVKSVGRSGYVVVAAVFLGGAIRGSFFPGNAPQMAGFSAALVLSALAATRVSARSLRSCAKLGVVAFVIAVVVLTFIAMEQGWSDSACSDFPDQPGCVTPDWFDATLTSLAALVGSTALIVVARASYDAASHQQDNS